MHFSSNFLDPKLIANVRSNFGRKCFFYTCLVPFLVHRRITITKQGQVFSFIKREYQRSTNDEKTVSHLKATNIVEPNVRSKYCHYDQDGFYCCTDDTSEYDEWGTKSATLVGFNEHYGFICPYTHNTFHEEATKTVKKIFTTTNIIIISAAGAGLLILLIFCSCCCCSKKKSNSKTGTVSISLI